MGLSNGFICAEEIKLSKNMGIYNLPVTINDAIKLNFIIDTGASHVTIPSDVLKTLMRTGTIQKSDMLGIAEYKLADGNTEKNTVFNIRKMKIGNKYIYNIKASASKHENTPLLLGQSALRKLEPWKIDSKRDLIVINENSSIKSKPQKTAVQQTRSRLEQYRLGKKYENEFDFKNAIYWYKKSAENKYTHVDMFGRPLGHKSKEGYAPAQYRLGALLLPSQLTPDKLEDPKKAKYWLAKVLKVIPEQASKGNIEAQVIYGLMYEDGNGVKQDLEKAIYWFKKAAEKGNIEAQHILGQTFEYKNNKKALYWYKQAARQGNVDSLISLARLYDYKEEYDKAIYWYRKAAKQGSSLAQAKLGEAYEKGEILQKSYKKAIYWYEKAAHQNNNYAFFNLGNMYCLGKGVKKDLKQCAYWISKVNDLSHLGQKRDLQKKADELWKKFKLWKYE